MKEEIEIKAATFFDLVDALRATREQDAGIPIAKVAIAFEEASWAKEEIEALIRELQTRYE